MRIVIIGAGIGGLAAAIALTNAGHKVVIVEQATQITEIGAGIQVPPNASRILINWGLREKFEAVSLLPGSIYLRSYRDSQVLSTQNLYPHTIDKYGVPFWHVHRADYHSILYQKVVELGVEVATNKRVVSIDFERCTVHTHDADSFAGDFIVGADGVKSVVRSLIAGEELPPRNTGDAAFRIVVDTAKVGQIESLKFLTRPDFNFWVGPNSHCVVYQMQGGRQTNMVFLAPDNLPPDVNIMDAGPDELKQLLGNWDTIVQQLAGLVESVKKWRLQTSPKLDSWVHATANVVLLGDSCHTTLPYLAQGAAQALEDAAFLGELFDSVDPDPAQAHELLKQFEKLRKTRTETVMEYSAELGRDVYHLEDGPEQQLRDHNLKRDPYPGYPNKFSDPDVQPFLFSYDAIAEGRAARAAANAASIAKLR